MTLNIFKDCHSGYSNLKIYSPIKFCCGHIFQWYKKLRSFNSHLGYKISRSHSPEEFFIALAIGLLLKSNTVISKEYVQLARPKIESRDPIFFTGTQSLSQVSGSDRLFPHGSEFRPNPEIPASPVIQLRPPPGCRRVKICNFAKYKQGVSQCFHLHARAPPVAVPR